MNSSVAKTVRKRHGPFQGKPLKLNNEHTLSEPTFSTDIGTDTTEPGPAIRFSIACNICLYVNPFFRVSLFAQQKSNL